MTRRGRPKQLDGDTRVVSVRITNNVYENIKARGDDISTTLREIIEAGISVNENRVAPVLLAARGELGAADIAVIEIAEKNQQLRRAKSANLKLRRQLAERTDSPAAPSPIDDLSPAARAEFERIVRAGALEKLLAATAKNHAERLAKRDAPTPAPELVDFPMPEIPEVVATPIVEKIED